MRDIEDDYDGDGNLHCIREAGSRALASSEENNQTNASGSKSQIRNSSSSNKKFHICENVVRLFYAALHSSGMINSLIITS